MRAKISVPVVLWSVLVLCLVGWTVYGQQKQQSPPRTVWEYKVVSESDKLSLNELGAQGWELVAVQMGGAQEVYYFKRQK